MTVDYDPFAPEVLADPYPWYRMLRDERPCAHVASRDLWVLSRYEDVSGAMRDHATYSSADGPGYERMRSGAMTSVDPPDHTRLRRLVNRHFLPRVVTGLEPWITAVVDALLDVAVAKGTCDWVAELARPLPTMVIAELLGVPAEHQPDFARWSNDVVRLYAGGLSARERAEVQASVADFDAFLHRVISEPQPRSALLRALLDASDADALSPRELVSFCVLLLVAGNETTTNAIGNATLVLLEHPALLWALQSDPSRIPSFVEEVIRYDAPVQAVFRSTTRDTGTIPAGARVMLLHGSANRDDRHYADPDTFRSARNPVDHVGFGVGIHACLGAPLARLEVITVIGAMARRLTRIEPAGDAVRTRSPLVRGVAVLPVAVATA